MATLQKWGMGYHLRFTLVFPHLPLFPLELGYHLEFTPMFPFLPLCFVFCVNSFFCFITVPRGSVHRPFPHSLCPSQEHTGWCVFIYVMRAV